MPNRFIYFILKAVRLDPKTVHAPEFGSVWLNSPPLSLRSLRGRTVLVDFWDYTCVNCIRTLPYVKEWHRRYREHGLSVIGIHAPEFYFARIPELVQSAVRDFGIEYPVLLDNEYQAWKAFANRYWPSKYLIDAEGYLRYFHPGEGNYGETEEAIQELLRERNPDLILPAPMAPLRAMDRPGAIAACQRPTGEIYLGSDPLPPAVTLAGGWIHQKDSVESKPDSEPSKLYLDYSAAEVNIVIASGAEAPIALIEVTENGAPLPENARGADVFAGESGVTYVKVDRPRMYALVRRGRFVHARLGLSTAVAGLELFAFTFGSCPE